MNQSAKKEITVSKKWFFDYSNRSMPRFVRTASFGNSKTKFYLSASKGFYGERKIDWSLHLESSNQKSVLVKGTFEYKSKTAICSGFEASFPFTAGKDCPQALMLTL